MMRAKGMYIPMFVFTPWAPFTTLRFVPNPLVAVGNSVGFSSDAASPKINPTTRVGCIFGAGEGDRVYAIFMLFGPFLPLFSIKNI